MTEKNDRATKFSLTGRMIVEEDSHALTLVMSRKIAKSSDRR